MQGAYFFRRCPRKLAMLFIRVWVINNSISPLAQYFFCWCQKHFINLAGGGYHANRVTGFEGGRKNSLGHVTPHPVCS